MKSQKNGVVIFTWFLAVLAAQVLLHLLLASNAVPTLTSFYLSESKRNSITTLFDNFLPAIILGIVNGWYGSEWSIRRIVVATALLCVGFLAQACLYQAFFRPGRLWWWPPTIGDVFFRVVTTSVLLAVFTYAGVRGRQNSK